MCGANMSDRPKPVYNAETPGPWIFDPGERGYPATRWEPEDPGYAPYIFARPPEGFGYDEDEETHQVKIAELFEPGIPDLDPDQEAFETYICWGDYKRNGKLMARAPEMWKLLTRVRQAYGEGGSAAIYNVANDMVHFVEEFQKELDAK